MVYTTNFICRAAKSDRHGLSPIELTISVNGSRVFMSLPIKHESGTFKKEYEKKGSMVRKYCDTYTVKVQGAVLSLMERGKVITAQNIKDALNGKGEAVYTVKMLFDDYLAWLRKRIDVSITFDNYQKYALIPEVFYNVCKGSTPVSELNVGIGEDYVLYVQKNYKNGTVKHKVSRLKSILKWGRDIKRIDVPDIFAGMVIKYDKPQGRKYLTEEELNRIEKKDFGIERLNKVKDIFLFQCYTGLAYKDMAGFRKEDVIEDESGRKFLAKERCKTGVGYTVLLLPKAMDILVKYDYRLPVLSNQKYNSFMHEIEVLCKIGINLTSHCGRHTCATYLLNHNVPLEIVSKVLGHSNTKITQSTYAMMLNKTVLDAMSKIA